MTNKIGIGSLFHIAKEHGYKPERKNGTKVKRLTKMNDDTIKQSVLADNSQLSIARNTIKSFGDDNLIYAESSFYIWDKQLWRPWDDLKIKQQITHVCELTNSALSNRTDIKSVFKEITSGRVDSILKLMKTEAFKPDVIFDKPNDVINVQNGELILVGNSWELLPHRRESYRASLIPVMYDPEAKAPRFLKFLDEVFANDEDHQEKRTCVCQFMGYSLTTNCKYEKFLLLIGGGENGKSVLLYVVDNLVGSHNCSAIDPSNFTKDFHLAHLRGKYVNIVPEIAEGAEIDDAAFKSITSGDKKQASKKYKDLFDFYPYAKLWLGTQYLPHSRDVSHAFFRRPLIIQFNHIFRKANDPDRKPEDQLADVELKPKLLSELSGILNIALEGLARLKKDGGFTEPSSSYSARASWRMSVDQVAQFVDERCRVGDGMIIEFKALYADYKEWALQAGISKTFTRKKFGQRLEARGFKTIRGSGGTVMRMGIDIDPFKNN